MRTYDHSKRTSPFYDDRDGDTVTQLSTKEHPIIKVCTGPAPDRAFFLVPHQNEVVSSNPDGSPDVPQVDLDIHCYVNMASLSENLKQQVRSELDGRPNGRVASTTNVDVGDLPPGQAQAFINRQLSNLAG